MTQRVPETLRTNTAEIGILAMESSCVLRRIHLSGASDSLVVEWGLESLRPHRGVGWASETARKADTAAYSQCLVNVTIMILAVTAEFPLPV